MRQAAALAALLSSGCAATIEGPPRVAGAWGDGVLPVAHMEDRRYAGVIRQRYDFSCGSAALATLLRHHYGYAVDEDDAFRGMWAKGDRAQIRTLGFSLLDMKRWLASHGLSANGYKVSLEAIAQTGVPGIALISVRNYRHFVVVKGVRGDEVLIGDPSAGLVTMSRDAFLRAWNGVYFVISDEAATGKQRFNRPQQWAAVARAPISHTFNDPLALSTLALTAPFYGDF